MFRMSLPCPLNYLCLQIDTGCKHDSHSSSKDADLNLYRVGNLVPVEAEVPSSLSQDAPQFRLRHEIRPHFRFPMEMHMVHYSAEFENFTEALASGKQTALAVLGFFFQVALEFK